MEDIFNVKVIMYVAHDWCSYVQQYWLAHCTHVPAPLNTLKIELLCSTSFFSNLVFHFAGNNTWYKKAGDLIGRL